MFKLIVKAYLLLRQTNNIVLKIITIYFDNAHLLSPGIWSTYVGGSAPNRIDRLDTKKLAQSHSSFRRACPCRILQPASAWIPSPPATHSPPTLHAVTCITRPFIRVRERNRPKVHNSLCVRQQTQVWAEPRLRLMSELVRPSRASDIIVRNIYTVAPNVVWCIYRRHDRHDTAVSGGLYSELCLAGISEWIVCVCSVWRCAWMWCVWTRVCGCEYLICLKVMARRRWALSGWCFGECLHNTLYTRDAPFRRFRLLALADIVRLASLLLCAAFLYVYTLRDSTHNTHHSPKCMYNIQLRIT